MIPQSMTGYGRGISGSYRVEIRSSNHKNLDIHVNVPYYLYPYETDIRKILKQTIHRGRVEIFVPKQEIENIRLKVNKSLAAEYYKALVSLKDELSISDAVGIDIIASQKDIFMLDEPEVDISGFHKAFDMALEELQKTRCEEGRNLADDISERLVVIGKYITNIEMKRDTIVASSKEKLHERLKEFLKDVQIDESRLVQEVAIQVEKTDITEEIVRIKSHLDHFTEVLKSGDSVGKKLDFIVQEMRREINTIGSKAQDYEIANNVVEVKHELEKIREQIQNLQ